MLLIDEARAIETLPALLSDDLAIRPRILAVLRSVVEATGEIPEEVARRMAAVERIFTGDPVAESPQVAARRIRPAARPA